MAKRISLTELDAVIAACKSGAESTVVVPLETGGGETVPVQVRTVISLQEMGDLASGVADALFPLDEDGNEVYTPYYREAMLALFCIKYYTNLKPNLGDVRLGALLYETGVMKQIYAVIDAQQWMDIEAAVCEAIAFRKQTLLSAQRQQLMQVAGQLDGLTSLLAKNAAVISKLDPATLSAAVKAFGETQNRQQAEVAPGMFEESR